jgi:hypothetical protein
MQLYYMFVKREKLTFMHGCVPRLKIYSFLRERHIFGNTAYVYQFCGSSEFLLLNVYNVLFAHGECNDTFSTSHLIQDAPTSIMILNDEFQKIWKVVIACFNILPQHLLLQNSKVQRHVHNNPPLDPILGQMNPVHVYTSCFFKVHFNIIFPPMSGLPNNLFLSAFPTKIFYTFSLFDVCYTPCPSHPPQFDHHNNIR